MIHNLVGLILILSGGAHFFPGAAAWEMQIISPLQNRLGKDRSLDLFQQLWFLGRTFFTICFLIILTAVNPLQGLTTFGIFLGAATVERMLKISINRTRPYQAYPEIEMYQPQRPLDPSFPSGDCLRIWYLALLFPVITGPSLSVLLVSILLAVLVSLGRIVMGVHYLSDVLTGSGLGILSAGTTIWIWQLLGLS